MNALKSDLLVSLTADIVAAHVSNNRVAIDEISGLIADVHAALAKPTASPAQEVREPAVPIRQSIKRNHIICLEDGAKLKMLRRYLKARYDLTPDQYRARWNLPADYPMVAPDYSDRRRALAKQIGLGTRPNVG